MHHYDSNTPSKKVKSLLIWSNNGMVEIAKNLKTVFL